MATALLSHQVSDLTLGKPPLPWLPLSASVADALRALKQPDSQIEISIWDCSPTSHFLLTSDVDSAPEGAIQGPDVWHRLRNGECRCVGKVCVQMVMCYLFTDESLSDLPKAFCEPVSVLLRGSAATVQHIDCDASILDILDLIVGGIQNLVVPIDNPFNRFSNHCANAKKFLQKANSLPTSLHRSHNGRDYCWLTHEDVMRFLLRFVAIFSPLLMMNIQDLGVINTDVLMVDMDETAISAFNIIREASHLMTAVAVVENDTEKDPKLVGEISCSTLQNCDETVAFAITTLSVRDFLVYMQDCKNPRDAPLERVGCRICDAMESMKGDGTRPISDKKPVSELLKVTMCENHNLETWEESSDEEPGDLSHGELASKLLLKSSKFSKEAQVTAMAMAGAVQGRVAQLMCRPWSSLVAVILQALAHRENYVWVTNEDATLVGVVTFTHIIQLLFNHLCLPTT